MCVKNSDFCFLPFTLSELSIEGWTATGPKKEADNSNFRFFFRDISTKKKGKSLTFFKGILWQHPLAASFATRVVYCYLHDIFARTFPRYPSTSPLMQGTARLRTLLPPQARLQITSLLPSFNNQPNLFFPSPLSSSSFQVLTTTRKLNKHARMHLYPHWPGTSACDCLNTSLLPMSLALFLVV